MVGVVVRRVSLALQCRNPRPNRRIASGNRPGARARRFPARPCPEAPQTCGHTGRVTTAVRSKTVRRRTRSKPSRRGRGGAPGNMRGWFITGPPPDHCAARRTPVPHATKPGISLPDPLPANRMPRRLARRAKGSGRSTTEGTRAHRRPQGTPSPHEPPSAGLRDGTAPPASRRPTGAHVLPRIRPRFGEVRRHPPGFMMFVPIFGTPCRRGC